MLILISIFSFKSNYVELLIEFIVSLTFCLLVKSRFRSRTISLLLMNVVFSESCVEFGIDCLSVILRFVVVLILSFGGVVLEAKDTYFDQ